MERKCYANHQRMLANPANWKLRKPGRDQLALGGGQRGFHVVIHQGNGRPQHHVNHRRNLGVKP